MLGLERDRSGCNYNWAAWARAGQAGNQVYFCLKILDVCLDDSLWPLCETGSPRCGQGRAHANSVMELWKTVSSPQTLRIEAVSYMYPKTLMFRKLQ